jgi:hypothetical protein
MHYFQLPASETRFGSLPELQVSQCVGARKGRSRRGPSFFGLRPGKQYMN